MIRTQLSGLFFVYVLVFLAVILGVWIAWEMARRFRDNQALKGRLQCAVCGLVYRQRQPSGPEPCPGCGALNEHGKIKIY